MFHKRIIILGSTGSIGTQTLEVVAAERDYFEVVGLSANTNESLLQHQKVECGAPAIFLAERETQTLAQWIEGREADLVVVAIAGVEAVAPTLAALRSGKDVALANKECLVMAGQEIMEEAQKQKRQIIPIDSEHSALFQCLQKVNREEVEKIILTCSGGPFWGKTREQLERVTVAEALRHPTWNMGPKITIDSATLINKGLEVIEAHHLFGFDYDRIEVRVHPQSLVHGMVQLKDGNTLMHLAPPSMKIPIHYALHYPHRVDLPYSSLQLKNESLLDRKLEFFAPDVKTFEGLTLAYEVGRKGGNVPAKFVHANEAAVQDFLSGKIGFLEQIKMELAGSKK